MNWINTVGIFITTNIEKVSAESVGAKERSELSDNVYEPYQPSVRISDSKPHPGSIVESAAMSAVSTAAIAGEFWEYWERISAIGCGALVKVCFVK